MYKFAAFVILFCLSVTILHADTVNTLGIPAYAPKAELSLMNGISPKRSFAVSISYPIVVVNKGVSLYADAGLINDDFTSTKGAIFGVSTDANIPVLEKISLETRVGAGYSTQSNTWMFYVRVPLF